VNAPVLAILDSDLKAPQPALHKAQQIADASQRPLHVLVNAYSSAMVGLSVSTRSGKTPPGSKFMAPGRNGSAI
jgi:hypothetical protein